jgi:hypothetical protein
MALPTDPPSPASGATCDAHAEDGDLRARLDALVDALFALAQKRGGPGGLIGKARRRAHELGFAPNPLGNRASKLGLMATYRPLDTTCPARCPMRGRGCYAEQGHVDLAQRRASARLDASLSAAAIAMVLAVRYRQVARLHVSGDFATDGDGLDTAYLSGLCALSARIRHHGIPPSRTLAYGYTHVDPALMGDWFARLSSSGIQLRASGVVGVEGGGAGALVHPFEGLDRLRARYPGARLAKCRAQLDDITQCVDCKLCWERPDLTIVFEPHSAGKKHVLAQLVHAELGHL